MKKSCKNSICAIYAYKLCLKIAQIFIKIVWQWPFFKHIMDTELAVLPNKSSQNMGSDNVLFINSENVILFRSQEILIMSIASSDRFLTARQWNTEKNHLKLQYLRCHNTFSPPSTWQWEKRERQCLILRGLGAGGK